MSVGTSKRKRTVVTACLNAGGMPDFALTEVEVTDTDYANGSHHDLVAQRLVAAGYEAPFVHYDEEDAPAFLVPAVRHYLGGSDPLPPDQPITLGGT
jgi:hypothetical protein